jgi:hypothetical protein
MIDCSDASYCDGSMIESCMKDWRKRKDDLIANMGND